MDLILLKEFFSYTHIIQAQLQSKQSLFSRIPAYSLFKLLSPNAQPNISSTHIKKFIKTFNWSLNLPSSNNISQKTTHKIIDSHITENPQQILENGSQLLVKYWGSDGSISFDQFALMMKGKHQLPDHKNKQVPFQKKKQFFETILQQIQNLLKLQTFKKTAYYQYRNMTDLFQTLTPTNQFTRQHLHRLFNMYGQRKTQKQMDSICVRIKLPCNFDQFLKLFKQNSTIKKQFKVHYSSKRCKKRDDSLQKNFTTPRKPKNIMQQSSTKVTKGALTDLKRQSILISEFDNQDSNNEHWKIIAYILQLEQEYTTKKIQLIQHPSFDLQLVYQVHGKKFQTILNKKYASCNFSAFVRFIVPQTYEHRYLSFIRYNKDNILPNQINQGIDNILLQYTIKQNKIQQVWKQTDKELTFRALCLPRQQAVSLKKLNQFFTKRQIDVLCDRMDPHNKGHIQILNFN